MCYFKTTTHLVNNKIFQIDKQQALNCFLALTLDLVQFGIFHSKGATEILFAHSLNNRRR